MDVAPQLPHRRHRGIQWTGVIVSLLFLGSILVLLRPAARPRSALPGTDSILSLAAIPPGFLVGRATGVDESRDGSTWLVATNIPQEPVGVASDGTTAYVLAGSTLKETTDLKTFTTRESGVAGTVLAAGPDRTAYVVAGATIARIGPGGSRLGSLPAPASPTLLSMAVIGGRALSVLVGGVAGLWRTDDGESWHRLLATPVQAVVVDPANPQRILLGTPGGVLVSDDGGQQWRFGTLRKDVHGLSAGSGAFFAVTTERIVYESNDGESGWKPV